MLNRPEEIETLRLLLRRYPVVGLIGARQVGKTTLARMLERENTRSSTYFDLENPEDQARMADPMLALRNLRGLIIIDEIQHKPEIFPVLRVLADRPRSGAKFLILGSASPDLIQRSAESLAGRIAYHELQGFSLREVGIRNYEKLWVRGGFPQSYLASTNAASMDWRLRFIKTFLERDLPQLGVLIRSTTLRRFWSMLAHYHGQVWNSSEFARSFGVADTTVRNYLDLLSSALVVRQLAPWSENISKRQVKSPKVYIADSGLLHGLLNLPSMNDIHAHPKLGASWEGFLVGQITRSLGARPEECFFWATHAGAELDLLVVRGRQRIGFEMKRTVAPQLTRSMRSAIVDLKLKKLFVIHAGNDLFPLAHGVTALPFDRILTDIEAL
ncbi:MAG: ATP-binding protein [Ignavibacteriales bacterium]|nr:ATP-binding protein [Ignavibacteriales bacterium]